MIKTFAQLKRDLKVGAILTLVKAENKNTKYPHKYLNIPREIIKQQTNAVKLEGGSWLGLGSTGETAKDFEYIGCTFMYVGGGVKLTYLIS